MSNQVIERNTAQVQLMADIISKDAANGSTLTATELNSVLQTVKPVAGSELFLINVQGDLIADSQNANSVLPLNLNDLALLTRDWKPTSQLMESTAIKDEMVVSFAPLMGMTLGVIITEPWAAVMSLASNFQIVLGILLITGTALSLGMLSISIGRVIRPLTTLSKHAANAVPGSIFHPVALNGPSEIKVLIQAFNQMVIRLAEQQTALRQFAHTALLSQEDERQRLSHELHDGTLQDLVGLVQRVQLCSDELNNNPKLAQERLDEVHKLLQQTLEDVHRISTALRPPVLEDFGLSIALDSLCQELKKDMPGVHCTYSVSGKKQHLNPDLELAVYRVVQEALTNIRKHAKDATQVQVELSFGETKVRTIVKNNGAFFANQDVRSLVRSGHLGLAGMYERACLFGGTLKVTATPNKNTVITLQLPFFQDTGKSEI